MSQIKNLFLAQMPTLTLKGNNTGSTFNPLDLTVAQVNAILPVFTSTLNGLAPLSGGGTSNFLRADGTWTAISAANLPTITFTGDVTGAASGGSIPTTVAKIQTTVVSGTTGSGNVVFSASPTFTGTIAGASQTLSGTLAVTQAVTEGVSVLTDGATPALNAALGNLFTLSAAGDRTIAVPTNPTSGQKIVIRHTASGGARTLALNTGAGGFRFGSDISALTQTVSGKTDYIGCIYNAASSTWDVVAYTKGF